LLARGYNADGQLGDGTTIDSYDPIDITDQIAWQFNETVKDIDCGLWHTVLLTSNGRVFTWGDNYQGQLGVDGYYYGSISTPTDITGEIPLVDGEKIIFVEVNTHANILISNLGKIYVFGLEEDFYFYTGISTNTLRHPTLLDASLNDLFSTGEQIEFVHTYDQSFLVTTNQYKVFYWNFNNSGFIASEVTDRLFYYHEYNEIFKISGDLVLMDSGDLFIIHFDSSDSYAYPAVRQLHIFGPVSTEIIDIPYNEDLTETLSHLESRIGFEFAGISNHPQHEYEDKRFIITEDTEVYVKWKVME
jgi:hypothetical protein